MAQKPPAPPVRHAVLTDPNTGAIISYVRGTNFNVDNDNTGWADITDVPGVTDLAKLDIRSMMIKKGQLRPKPKLKLILDKREMEESGKAKLRLESEGSTAYLPEEVIVKIGRKKVKMRLNEEVEICGTRAGKISVSLDDHRVYCANKHKIHVKSAEEMLSKDLDDGIVINHRK